MSVAGCGMSSHQTSTHLTDESIRDTLRDSGEFPPIYSLPRIRTDKFPDFEVTLDRVMSRGSLRRDDFMTIMEWAEDHPGEPVTRDIVRSIASHRNVASVLNVLSQTLWITPDEESSDPSRREGFRALIRTDRGHYFPSQRAIEIYREAARAGETSKGLPSMPFRAKPRTIPKGELQYTLSKPDSPDDIGVWGA